jgi:hypothetical protein
MRKVLLLGAAAIMVLVPVTTGAVLAFLPKEVGCIPMWFWVAWFLFSVCAALDAPLRVVSLLPRNRGYQSIRYGRVGMALALGNVVWSIAAVIYLGWWV